MKFKRNLNNLPARISDYAPHYSEPKLLKKLQRVARKVGGKTLHVVLVLFYALNSPNISLQDKAKIYGALGYFILPIDLLPDAVPFAGYTDDWIALLYVLKQVADQITPEVRQKADAQVQKWLGEDPSHSNDI